MLFFFALVFKRTIRLCGYDREHQVLVAVNTQRHWSNAGSIFVNIALDLDEMPIYDSNQAEKPKFSGKRIERGLCRAADDTLINADCNGSASIIMLWFLELPVQKSAKSLPQLFKTLDR